MPGHHGHELLSGNGEMAEAIRSHNWEATPLGPIADWPDVLLGTLNLMLASPVGMSVIWGPEKIILYNDAYRLFLGDRHPGSLGHPAEEVWSEAWHIIGPQIEAALTSGAGTYHENYLVPIEINHQLTNHYWSYSFSPVYDRGRIAGVFNVCRNTTEAMNAAASLRESETRSKRILQSIGDAVIVTDAEACVTRMNPVAEQLTGWTEEDAQGLPLNKVFHIINERTREVVESPADKVRRTGAIAGLANHTILVRRDGTEVHIDDSGAPIRDESGKITGIVLVFRDIEDRRRTERERNALSRQVNQILEATTDSVLAIDRNWRITYMNPVAKAVLAPSGNIIGTNFWETFPDAVHEGSIFMENYYRAMDEGVAGRFEAFYPGPLNISVSVEVRPEPNGIVLFFRDITEQKKKEAEREQTLEALHRSEERLRLALAAANGMGAFDWYVQKDRLYGDAEFARMFDMDAVQLTEGVSIAEFFRRLHPEDRQRVDHAIAQAISTGEDYATDYRIVHRDGSVHWIAARGMCSLDDDGAPVRFPGVVLDITTRKRTEEVLIRSEKLAAVGRLAASIAHEINNPLEAVTNLLYLARNSDNMIEAQDYLQIAERELRRASAITSQTLRFHRQSTRPSAISCADLIGDALSIYQGRLLNSRVTVEKRKRADRLLVCYEGEIRQVMANLVGNAIDAMPDGGRLLVRSREATEWQTGRKGLVLTVADTGAGMPRETLGRIFEPFFTTKGDSGTGLGLWISREIVARHHGELRVRSRPGAGTVFTVFLPFEAASR